MAIKSPIGMQRLTTALFELMRLAFGVTEKASVHLSPEEWQKLYALAKKQSLLGVVFSGIKHLSEEDLPPRNLRIFWAADTEVIRETNRQLNREAARLTEIFTKAGRRTAVLKGPANARLYPDPELRQCGDIDLWVEGGFKSVKDLLYELNLLNADTDDHAYSLHHIHLPPNKDGIITEVHFKPASGNPIGNRGLQKFLNQEILKAELAPEGFYVPSIKFALVMQLSHLQQHFYSRGLGFRQYVDYFVLLQNSTQEDRDEVSGIIKSLYMTRACSAVMWVLQQIFGLKPEKMLCTPDQKRGQRLLDLALRGGNFGHYVIKPRNVFVRWFKDRLNALSWLPFDPLNAIFKELRYWRATISLIPRRIKRRKIAL